jgi:hypothetical protein
MASCSDTRSRKSVHASIARSLHGSGCVLAVYTCSAFSMWYSPFSMLFLRWPDERSVKSFAFVAWHVAHSSGKS